MPIDPVENDAEDNESPFLPENLIERVSNHPSASGRNELMTANAIQIGINNANTAMKWKMVNITGMTAMQLEANTGYYFTGTQHSDVTLTMPDILWDNDKNCVVPNSVGLLLPYRESNDTGFTGKVTLKGYWSGIVGDYRDRINGVTGYFEVEARNIHLTFTAVIGNLWHLTGFGRYLVSSTNEYLFYDDGDDESFMTEAAVKALISDDLMGHYGQRGKHHTFTADYIRKHAIQRTYGTPDSSSQSFGVMFAATQINLDTMLDPCVAYCHGSSLVGGDRTPFEQPSGYTDIILQNICSDSQCLNIIQYARIANDMSQRCVGYMRRGFRTSSSSSMMWDNWVIVSAKMTEALADTGPAINMNFFNEDLKKNGLTEYATRQLFADKQFGDGKHHGLNAASIISLNEADRVYGPEATYGDDPRWAGETLDLTEVYGTFTAICREGAISGATDIRGPELGNPTGDIIVEVKEMDLHTTNNYRRLTVVIHDNAFVFSNVTSYSAYDENGNYTNTFYSNVWYRVPMAMIRTTDYDSKFDNGNFGDDKTLSSKFTKNLVADPYMYYGDDTDNPNFKGSSLDLGTLTEPGHYMFDDSGVSDYNQLPEYLWTPADSVYPDRLTVDVVFVEVTTLGDNVIQKLYPVAAISHMVPSAVVRHSNMVNGSLMWNAWESILCVNVLELDDSNINRLGSTRRGMTEPSIRKLFANSMVDDGTHHGLNAKTIIDLVNNAGDSGNPLAVVDFEFHRISDNSLIMDPMGLPYPSVTATVGSFHHPKSSYYSKQVLANGQEIYDIEYDVDMSVMSENEAFIAVFPKPVTSVEISTGYESLTPNDAGDRSPGEYGPDTEGSRATMLSSAQYDSSDSSSGYPYHPISVTPQALLGWASRGWLIGIPYFDEDYYGSGRIRIRAVYNSDEISQYDADYGKDTERHTQTWFDIVDINA